jgi:hypothetical protein
MRENPNGIAYRHWFLIALLVLINVVIFGCVILALAEKMYFA